MLRILLAATTACLAGCGTPASNGDGACNAFVSRSVNANLDLAKVNEWKLVIGISDEVYYKLETLQGDHAFRARNLCLDKPTYEKAGRLDEYFCRTERLDRSVEQLRVLDLAFKGLNSEKDAQEKAGAIKNGLDYYFKNFATNAACSAPPSVRQIDDLRGEINGLRVVIIEQTDRITQIERKLAKPRSVEEVAREIGYKEVLPPSDALLPAIVSGVANAGGGFRVKSYLLIAELYFRETVWMLDPGNGGAGLERQPLATRLAPKPRAAIDNPGLSQARERTRVQLDLVRYFSDRRASIFLPLQTASAISSRDERRAEVGKVIARLELERKRLPSGSFYNFLGTLALANEENERALKYYYEGYLEDPEHLPIHESLAYSFWRLHGDSKTARKYAASGFGLVQELSLRWRRQREQAAANLATLRAANIGIESYAREVTEFYAKAEPVVASYFNGMFERFASGLAYYNAHELLDREQSHRLIKEVIERRPENANDADYVDTQGFVTLRFARTLDEVDGAIRAFQRAKELATTKEQIDLFNLHLGTALKIKEQVSRS